MAVTLSEEMAPDQDDRTLEGAIVVTDEDDGDCEAGQHSLGSGYLITIDESNMVVSTCLSCTAAELASGTVESMKPREQREPDAAWEARIGPHLG